MVAFDDGVAVISSQETCVDCGKAGDDQQQRKHLAMGSTSKINIGNIHKFRFYTLLIKLIEFDLILLSTIQTIR